MYFNPRLREGGDSDGEMVVLPSKISIHASAKEATIIQHDMIAFFINFNPRLREGGDIDAEVEAYRKQLISIHASAKEATAYEKASLCGSPHFNPRLREGGDDITVF